MRQSSKIRDLPFLHVAEIDRRKVMRLADALADSQANQEAASAIRSLIGDVVLTPGERRGEVNATLRGELLAILDITSGGHTPRTAVPGVISNAVASPRFEPTIGLREICGDVFCTS